MDTGTAQTKNDPVASTAPVAPAVSSGTVGGVERGARVAVTEAQHALTGAETVPPLERETTESETMPQQGVVVELPPDVQTLGGGTPALVTSAATPDIPPVQLPVSDDAVVRGLHTDITNPLLWLANWCVRKLKKAHVLLKVIHGKVVRVKE